MAAVWLKIGVVPTTVEEGVSTQSWLNDLKSLGYGWKGWIGGKRLTRGTKRTASAGRGHDATVHFDVRVNSQLVYSQKNLNRSWAVTGFQQCEDL